MAMKDLAKSLTDEFYKAVAKQERHDGERAAAISSKLEQAYKAYSHGLEAIRLEQIALGEQYRICLEAEGRLQNTFERELQEVFSQFAQMVFMKDTQYDSAVMKEFDSEKTAESIRQVLSGRSQPRMDQPVEFTAKGSKALSQMGTVKRIPT